MSGKRNSLYIRITESNNMAVIGTAMANKRKGNHVIVSSVEHSSVKEPFNFLEEQGSE